MGVGTAAPERADPFAPLFRTAHGEDYNPTCYQAVRRALARGKWAGPPEEHPEFEELLAAAAAALPRAAAGYRAGHASGAKPSTFAFTCAHNAAVDHLRRVGRVYRVLDPMDPLAYPVLDGRATDPDSLEDRPGFAPASEDGMGIAIGDWLRSGHSLSRLARLVGPPVHAVKHGSTVLREVTRLQASDTWSSADRVCEGTLDRRWKGWKDEAKARKSIRKRWKPTPIPPEELRTGAVHSWTAARQGAEIARRTGLSERQVRHAQQRIADLARLLTWAYLLAEGSGISPAGVAAVTHAGIAIPGETERIERKAAESEAYRAGRLDTFLADVQRFVTTKRSKRGSTLPWP